MGWVNRKCLTTIFIIPLEYSFFISHLGKGISKRKIAWALVWNLAICGRVIAQKFVYVSAINDKN